MDPVAARHQVVVMEVAAHTTREPWQPTEKLEVAGLILSYSTDLYAAYPHTLRSDHHGRRIKR